MKTKIQIKAIWGKVIFEHESENNSTKKTLEQARKEGADLGGADLRGAYLVGAYLRGAYLVGADLRRADLEGADLRGAYLEGADLPIFCKWSHYIRAGKINVGCKSKTPKEWIEWLESDREYETKRGTIEFKRIEATIRAYCAYVDTMGEDLYPKTEKHENGSSGKD
jgi:hypothetical protein